MGKAPASLFYWGDVARDPDLRRCTHAEVGVWFRILCLMFEAEVKGVLATHGIAWSDDEIAFSIGGDLKETKRCVTALVTKGVASRIESGALINRRMYREYLERLATKERVSDWRAKRSGDEPVTVDVTAEKQFCNENVPVRARAETEDETTSSEEVTTPNKNKLMVPDWIPRRPWDDFVESRKALRSPLTDRAATLIIRRLELYRASGQDPGAILDQSTESGWKGIFELKQNRGSNGKAERNSNGAAVGRVNRGLEGLRKAAEESGDYAVGPDDCGDGGILPASGNPGSDPAAVPRGIQDPGDGAWFGQSENGSAVSTAPSRTKIFSPSFRGDRGA